MVKYDKKLDAIFGSLADPTRRDILKRVSCKELSVSEIAMSYRMSLPAVSKHLKVLEEAELILRRKDGKHYFASLSPLAFKQALKHLEEYGTKLQERYDGLEKYLKEHK